MKVAVLSESPADQAAVRVLVEELLGKPTVPPPFPLQAPGWPAVRNLLPTVIKQPHYHSDTEGLVVVVDSDSSPMHRNEHEDPGGECAKCRLCELRRAVSDTIALLRAVPKRPPLKVAVGLAVPSIEAWYRCGVDPHVTEAAWILAVQEKSFPYTKASL